VFNDDLRFVHGAHNVQLGGSITRLQDNLDIAGVGSLVEFLSWPDFLLGMSATENGTGTFSNVFVSGDFFGLLNREYRVWEGALFAQDDYKITKPLTLNLGLRYERLGQFGDALGRNSSFDVTKADPNPSPGGSLAGNIVASNFPGTPPPGVQRVGNTFGDYNANPNTIAPRIGFAWQISPDTSRLLLPGRLRNVLFPSHWPRIQPIDIQRPLRSASIQCRNRQRERNLCRAFSATIPNPGFLPIVRAVFLQHNVND
jgi:outer membrane receptor protein involved in Fe transport